MNSEKLASMLEKPAIMKQRIEEEHYQLVDFLVANKDEFLNLGEQARLIFIRQYFERIMME
jgi:hypothetical protein